jgi:hypothetical protein
MLVDQIRLGGGWFRSIHSGTIQARGRQYFGVRCLTGVEIQAAGQRERARQLGCLQHNTDAPKVPIANDVFFGSMIRIASK